MVYVFACASLLAACLVQTLAALPPLWIWGFPAFTGLIGLCKFPSVIARQAGVALIGFALLGFWGQLCSEHRLDSYLPVEQEIKSITLRGTIVDIPARNQDRIRLTVQITASPIKELKTGTRIFLNHYTTRTSATPPPFQAGQEWQFSAKLKRPHGLLNPGGADSEAWLWAEGIRATGNIKTALFLKNCTTLPCKVAHWREQLSLSIQQKLKGQEYSGLISALVVGDGSAIPQKQWTLFRQTGVLHLVSISGLHITLIAGLIAALASFVWKRIPNAALYVPTQRIGFYSALCAAFVYSLMAGFSIPTQRTLFMLLALGISYFWGEKNFLKSLAWALITVLLYDPFAVLAAGTWLSFGAVMAMSLGAIGQLGQRSGFKEWSRAQWAVTIGLIPALILYFGQIPLSSPLANTLAIPIVSALVTPLALFGALGNWDLPLLFAAEIMQLLSSYLDWCNQIGTWSAAQPSFALAFLAATGIAYHLLPAALPCRNIALLFILPILMPNHLLPEPGEWQATIIDVGQGLAVLIQTQDSNTLYDTGPDWPGEGDSGLNIVIPTLQGLGVTQIDDLILSHNDNDHIGGANSVLAAMPVHRLYASLPAEHSLWNKSRNPEACHLGDVWSRNQVNFEVLNPAPNAEGENDNDSSCVIKISGKSGSLLLTGDISADKERTLIEQKADLQTTILVAPHHGSKNSSHPDFIKQTQAQAVIFSAGYRNHFNHPHPDVITRYQAQKQYRTDLQGAIHIQSKNGQIHISSESEQSKRFWRSQ